MDHINNQNQNQNSTSSDVIDLTNETKENASKVVNAYCSISMSKKQRRPETINECTDTRPQKRSKIEQAQEHNLIVPSISNIINPITLPGTREILNLRRTPMPFHNNTIIPTKTPYMLSPFFDYSQCLPHSQNFSLTSMNGLEHSYNVGGMKPTMLQIPPIASNPPPSSSSSTSSRSSNKISPEIIDLTNDSDDNDCVVNEKETNRDLCWGMINTEILILYPRPCTGGKGEEEVQLKRTWGKKQEIRVFKDHGYEFGVVEEKLANVLIPLMDDQIVWTEATIPKNWPSTSMSMPLHIVLYGHPNNTKIVSTHLAERGVFLADPIVYNVETRYSNPHYPPPGNAYLNKINQKVYKGYSGGSIGTTTRSSEDIKNKMNKVFNSLMTAENMPELDPDQRLITTLYKHQKQALYFLMKREQYNDFTDDQTNELMSLWRTRFSAGRHVVYYNVVTNLEVNEKPVQMRGGIIADDMGLGKTIQMIALILGTQNEAIEFVKNPTVTSSSSNSTAKKTTSSQSADENSSLKSRGTLIICPLSTVANWEEQLASHVQEGALSVYVYHGGARISDPSYLINYDVVITTYNVSGTEYSKQSKPKNLQSKNTVNDSDSANSSTASALQQINWFRIILDEAHIIKDVNTVQSKAACSLKAERRWCLTGTPIQNKVEDLFALVKFLHMDPFNDKENWKKYILRPIKSIDPVGISRLQTLMKCITLRRTKTLNGKSLLALPPRHDHTRYLDLSDHERKLYDKIYNCQAERFRRYAEENNIMRHYVNILQSLLRLRQICAHYSLVKESDIPEDLEEEIVNEGLTPTRALMLLSIVKDSGMDQCGSCSQELVQTVVVTRCEHLFCVECVNKNMSNLTSSASVATSSEDQKVSTDCPICGVELFSGDICEINDSKDIDNDHITRPEGEKKSHSTKVKALLEDLVQAKEDGVKSVVFSQWTKMLDLIEDALNENDINFTRLDGTMSRAERTQNMETFKQQDDVSVILVSLKAGGVGLNLTAAQRAYLMDPFWNPSVENQAIDRIHRLGQTCAVDTIRFIIKDSVEEGILQLQERKLRLAELTLSEKLSKQDITRHRLEDLKVLFK
ncbi:SNF2 family N-terminal domain-containing protein [Glomus cerebriforme]|uniref:SNF2 family N-terminal domain-containing protein n=1 Tax=Glomus cerebriforme TaxID=658196 RepID=A0A397SJB3_9GLOM|nr:SNF2 family N-terminal domain-containing protein [Glomus cerebriforme]